MTSSLETTALCELLWKRVPREPSRQSTEGDRERQGSYTKGFRNEITMTELEMAGYTIRTSRVAWQTFELTADARGTRRVLEVLRGTAIVFKATQEGESQKIKFNSREEFIGVEDAPVKAWAVNEGALPAELMSDAV